MDMTRGSARWMKAMPDDHVHELTPLAARADQAFEALYREHAIDVFRYALILTSNTSDAEDVTSETFERGLHAWRDGRGPAGAGLPWLFTIARHLTTDRWRRAKREVRELVFHNLKEPDAASVEARIWLDAIVRVLPLRQRELVVLRYKRDLSDAEIGSLMALTESGVRSLAARAIATLRMHPEIWR
jgi:RNA polymerase sigma factor (sigma-70 family)